MSDVESLLRTRQQQRGFTEYFQVGDLVRFPLGVPENTERDYRIKAIYRNGVEVECDGFVYAHADEAVIRLGMTHAPDMSGKETNPLPLDRHCRPGRCMALMCCSYECSQGRCLSIPAEHREPTP